MIIHLLDGSIHFTFVCSYSIISLVQKTQIATSFAYNNDKNSFQKQKLNNILYNFLTAWCSFYQCFFYVIAKRLSFKSQQLNLFDIHKGFFKSHVAIKY